MEERAGEEAQICFYDGSVKRNHTQFTCKLRSYSKKKMSHEFYLYLNLYLYLFICHTITIITKKCQKKCRKKWRGGLKETIELMLIRPPQLQFFEDGIKITATDTK